MKTQLKIEGMSCGHCVVSVKNALQSVEGVEQAVVSLADGAAVVQCRAGASVEAMLAAIADEGYTARAV